MDLYAEMYLSLGNLQLWCEPMVSGIVGRQVRIEMDRMVWFDQQQFIRDLKWVLVNDIDARLYR